MRSRATISPSRCSGAQIEANLDRSRREALAQLERAASLDPSHPGVRLRYGLLLQGFGRPEDAATQLREVLRLAPGTRYADAAREAPAGR